MSDIRMARPEDYEKALEARRADRLGVNWGQSGAFGTSSWASSQGWELPFFGYKRAFIAKMLESPENFNAALMYSGIDVYIPTAQQIGNRSLAKPGRQPSSEELSSRERPSPIAMKTIVQDLEERVEAIRQEREQCKSKWKKRLDYPPLGRKWLSIIFLLFIVLFSIRWGYDAYLDVSSDEGQLFGVFLGFTVTSILIGIGIGSVLAYIDYQRYQELAWLDQRIRELTEIRRTAEHE